MVSLSGKIGKNLKMNTVESVENNIRACEECSGKIACDSCKYFIGIYDVQVKVNVDVC